MPTIEKTLKALETWFSSIQTYTAERDKLRHDSFLDVEDYRDRRRELDELIGDAYKKMRAIMERYDREPERHYLRHSVQLTELFKDGTYDENVFVMTKYPVAGESGAAELQSVIDAVEAGIKKRHYKPRLANSAKLHDWLWDNVEVYLLGCARGIAIVEDKYVAELNPNVAMEWGWMRGMLRDVLFLRETNFKHTRADWTGLLDSTFDWTNPSVGIELALDKFLPPRAAPTALP